MRIDGNKYIQFEFMADTGKTQDWLVVNKTYGTNLSNITWYPSWRQYTFQPAQANYRREKMTKKQDWTKEKWTCEAGKFICDHDCGNECKSVQLPDKEVSK
jgi:hypothetical protein